MPGFHTGTASLDSQSCMSLHCVLLITPRVVGENRLLLIALVTESVFSKLRYVHLKLSLIYTNGTQITNFLHKPFKGMQKMPIWYNIDSPCSQIPIFQDHAGKLHCINCVHCQLGMLI